MSETLPVFSFLYLHYPEVPPLYYSLDILLSSNQLIFRGKDFLRKIMGVFLFSFEEFYTSKGMGVSWESETKLGSDLHPI